MDMKWTRKELGKLGEGQGERCEEEEEERGSTKSRDPPWNTAAEPPFPSARPDHFRCRCEKQAELFSRTIFERKIEWNVCKRN